MTYNQNLVEIFYKLLGATLWVAMCCGCSKQPTAQTAVDAAAAAPTVDSQGRLVIVAQLVHASQTPDPKIAPYPDCAIVCEFRVLENEHTTRFPEHLLVAVPGFLKRQLQPAASMKLGRAYRVALPAKEGEKGALQTMHLVDDIENLDLPLYYTTEIALEAREVAQFPARSPEYYGTATEEPTSSAAKDPVPVKFPWSAAAAEDRAKVISSDLSRIKQLLVKNGGAWQDWHSRLEPFFKDLQSKLKAAPSGMLKREQHHYSAQRGKKYSELTAAADRGPLRMLVSLHRQLRERGIDLIVVPFPYKEVINSGQFSDLAPEDGCYAPWRLKFFHDLLEQDVEVLDLAPALHANEAGHRYLYYDSEDLHPADGGIQIAAREICRRLERYGLRGRADYRAVRYSLHPGELAIDAENPLNGLLPGAKYPVTRVLDAEGNGVPISEESPCPVIVMGDSFTVVPGPGTTSASIPAHMAYHMGEVPCQLLSMGSSDKAMRLLAREGGAFLANRCAMVFVFGPSRLFGSVSKTQQGGWDLIDLPPIRFR